MVIIHDINYFAAKPGFPERDISYVVGVQLRFSQMIFELNHLNMYQQALNKCWFGMNRAHFDQLDGYAPHQEQPFFRYLHTRSWLRFGNMTNSIQELV